MAKARNRLASLSYLSVVTLTLISLTHAEQPESTLPACTDPSVADGTKPGAGNTLFRVCHPLVTTNLPLATPAPLEQATNAQQSPIDTLLEAPGPTGPLKGTMLAPSNRQGPVLLMIPGSGPTDRDGNSPAGISAAPYRLLAEGLVTRGVTTVRIDKRGLGGSAAATPDGNAVTVPDYVTDVHAWVAVIRKRTDVSCVWLLGHSEGGLIAMAAAKNQPDICGLVLVSAAGRPMGEVLRDQLKANPANASLLDQALPAIDALEAGKRVDIAEMPPSLQLLFNLRVQGFLISVFSYDPVQLLSGFPKPVLILQGQRDIQVHEADARILKSADPQATLVLLPDVNHVLKSVSSDDLSANIAAYSNPGLPLASGVIDAIGDFLTANAKHRPAGSQK
jgi:pimeloyl-ACP methyl ester carboxylesterase